MSKLMYPAPLSTSPNMVEVNFCFRVNNTSDPDSIIPVNAGVTDITYTATGIFAVTFDVKYPVFVGMIGNVMGPSGGSAVNDTLVKCLEDSYDATTGILTLTTVDAGTAAAVAPANDSAVYVKALFCLNSTQCPRGSI